MLKKLSCSIFVILVSASISWSQTDFERGRDYYEIGDYEQAILYFTKSIDIASEAIKTRPFLGMSYVRLKQYNMADRAFKKPFKKGVYKAIQSDRGFKRIKFLSKLSALNPKIDRKDKVAGSTKLAVEFNKNGKVTFIYPYKTVNAAMTKGIVEAVRKIKFEPAEQRGKKVTMVKMVEYQLVF